MSDSDSEMLTLLTRVNFSAPSSHEALYSPMIVAVGLLGPLPRFDALVQSFCVQIHNNLSLVIYNIAGRVCDISLLYIKQIWAMIQLALCYLCLHTIKSMLITCPLTYKSIVPTTCSGDYTFLISTTCDSRWITTYNLYVTSSNHVISNDVLLLWCTIMGIKQIKPPLAVLIRQLSGNTYSHVCILYKLLRK